MQSIPVVVEKSGGWCLWVSEVCLPCELRQCPFLALSGKAA
jgi:hypothetical protein